jgi:hypothetical protein
MNELDVQRMLIDDTIALGGFGKKLAHKMLVGIADIFLQLPPFPTVFIEVKLIPETRRSGLYPLNLSPLQRKFLNDVYRAGGKAAWLLAVKDTTQKQAGGLWLAVGNQGFTVTKQVQMVHFPEALRRERGGTMPIRQILEIATGLPYPPI